MSIALIGLVGFQFYWINSALRLNNERFANDVHKSLISVANKMEKKEILEFTGQSLFSSIDTLHFNHVDEPNSVERVENKELIVVKPSDPKMGKHTIKFLVESENWKESPDSLPSRLHIEQHINDCTIVEDKLVYGKMQERKKMIDVVFKEIMNYDLSNNRVIDTVLLDSLLNAELENQGIVIDYEYKVGNNDSLIDESGIDSFSANNFIYKTNLFPNDLLGNTSYLLVNFPNKNQFLLKKIWITLASSFLLLLIILFCFTYAILTILRQKKLSDIKNDFINNMTHELKTPIATVSLACEALGENEIKSNENSFNKYLGIIQEENNRLSGHVEKVLQLATADREGIELNLEPIDLNALAIASINNISLQLSSRQGVIETEMNAKDSTSFVDRHHMLNVINNILDNALKYSGQAPKIKVASENQNGKIKLSVKDNGIGLMSDQTKKIFDKFYRVPTGNIHNVKGFGLGLSYAKNIIEAHKGTLTVKSELGKGSEFIIELAAI